MAELSEFEGLEVEAVGVEMPNAAGGLQEAMKFDPIELHHGDTGHLVLSYTVSKVRFDPVARGTIGPLRRVHVLHVDAAAPIESKQVEKHLANYSARIQKAKEEAEGVERLPGLDGDDLPIGDDFGGTEDEQLKQKEYDLRIEEGEDPEVARAAVWGTED